MDVEVLLSSAVITTIISGIISFLASRRQAMLQYITGERKEWRDKIREIASNLNGAGYKDTLKLLSELKVRINAWGNKAVSTKYSSDAHIWELINEIESKEFKGKNIKDNLEKKQKQLVEYLALLLKDDWERSKKEVKGDFYNIISLLLFFASGIYFVISVLYLNNEDIGVYQLISILVVYVLMIVSVYVILWLEMKIICDCFLDGSVSKAPKKYNTRRLIFSILIAGAIFFVYMILYAYILQQFLAIISCGENDNMIILVSTFIFFPAVLLLYYAETNRMEKNFNYNNAINEIRIKYVEIKEAKKDKEEKNESRSSTELSAKEQ